MPISTQNDQRFKAHLYKERPFACVLTFSVVISSSCLCHEAAYVHHKSGKDHAYGRTIKEQISKSTVLISWSHSQITTNAKTNNLNMQLDIQRA